MITFLVLVVLETVLLVTMVFAVDRVFTGGIVWVLVKITAVGVAQFLVVWIAAMTSGIEPGPGIPPPRERTRDTRNFKDLTPLEGCAIDDIVNGKDRL
jgi:hypothetical protein